MNRIETDSNGSLVASSPLFASVWLAFFAVVRKHYQERRAENALRKAENNRNETDR